MCAWHYRYAGLTVSSDLALPEWAVFEQREPWAEPDVRIVLNAPPAGQASDAVESWVTADEYRLAVPEAGVYQVRQGSEITVTPATHTDTPEVRLFLLGSAWGALCYQRGLLVLHLSAVLAGEQAIGFCGGSGSGKSTLTAGLVARGYPLVSDDLSCITFAAGRPQVHPSAPRVKLWGEAVTQLGWAERALTRDHFRLDKFHVASLPHAAGQPWPLRALYLLRWGETGLTRLTGLSAVQRLIGAATYRADLVEPLRHLGSYWEQCLQLARAIPLWELSRPKDWADWETGLARLTDNW